MPLPNTNNDRPEWVKDSTCRSCGSKIQIGSFSSQLSRIEWEISGSCQRCQNEHNFIQ